MQIRPYLRYNNCCYSTSVDKLPWNLHIPFLHTSTLYYTFLSRFSWVFLFCISWSLPQDRTLQDLGILACTVGFHSPSRIDLRNIGNTIDNSLRKKDIRSLLYKMVAMIMVMINTRWWWGWHMIMVMTMKMVKVMMRDDDKRWWYMMVMLMCHFDLYFILCSVSFVQHFSKAIKLVQNCFVSLHNTSGFTKTKWSLFDHLKQVTYFNQLTTPPSPPKKWKPAWISYFLSSFISFIF